MKTYNNKMGKSMIAETHKECMWCGATKKLYVIRKDCECCGRKGIAKCHNCVTANKQYQEEVYERTGNWPNRASAKWIARMQDKKSEDWK